MYKAQYKKNSPYETWATIGVYGTESAAMSSAMSFKNKGALVVRVIDKNGSVVYSG